MVFALRSPKMARYRPWSSFQRKRTLWVSPGFTDLAWSHWERLDRAGDGPSSNEYTIYQQDRGRI